MIPRSEIHHFLMVAKIDDVDLRDYLSALSFRAERCSYQCQRSMPPCHFERSPKGEVEKSEHQVCLCNIYISQENHRADL